MKLVTLMDYHQEPYLTMCKIWLYLAKRFNPDARISIYGFSFHPILREYIKEFPHVELIEMKKQSVITNLTGLTDSCQDLQLSLLTYLKEPCIYIDADALILDSLQSWWDVIQEKPFIAVTERNYKGRPFFNAGVFSYVGGNSFISLSKMNKVLNSNHEIEIPLGGQGVINQYFQAINYDWTHPIIDHSYNCLIKNCVTKKLTRDEIEIYSGMLPVWLCYKHRLIHSESTWWHGWHGWNKSTKVKILHAYGDEFKFWKSPQTKLMWDFFKHDMLHHH